MEYLLAGIGLAGIGGLIAGGVVAWVVLSARARAAQATLVAKLDATERQLTDRTADVASLRERSGMKSVMSTSSSCRIPPFDPSLRGGARADGRQTKSQTLVAKTGRSNGISRFL